jgi:uncharacterized protein
MTLPIPPAAIAQHVLALGKTGSGKSSKLRVLVEFLLDREEPVTIIDPKGDWWGLKSSADGKGAGYPLIVFGGEHADIPINEHSGAHVAELVATGNRPALIDLGGWMVGERTRFFIAFAGAYFKLCKGKRTLVLPEVHNFAPQGKIMDPDAGKMLHWANRLASEGRGKGITILADSQRPQKCHKDFVTSCETLIACRVIHKLDRDAIKDWIDGCADPVAGRQVLADLAQMQRTDAWCWSPEIDFGPKRITWSMFKTYDSFKPQAADVGKLKGWASVDLDDVKARLATVVEEAKANDPRELKRKIDALNKELIALRKNQPPIYDGVALAAAEENGFTRGLAYGQNLANNMRTRLIALDDAREKLTAISNSIRDEIDGKTLPIAPRGFDPRVRNPAIVVTESDLFPEQRKPSSTRIANAALVRIGSSGETLSKAERAILTALVQCGGHAAKSRIAVITGYASTGGGFNNALSALRSKGYIGPGEPIKTTDDGIRAIGTVPPLPRGDELLDHWLRQLGKAEGAALKVIHGAFPNYISKEVVADSAGYEPSGGGFNNALSRLRTLELIEGRGELRASEAFFT